MTSQMDLARELSVLDTEDAWRGVLVYDGVNLGTVMWAYDEAVGRSRDRIRTAAQVLKRLEEAGRLKS